ncbi:MAG TPA: VWA domain-containing protein [Thermoanaerobaculia bacterium]|nr:VWA domain-containing protein [Thermoanaerobaculia bacterium]
MFALLFAAALSTTQVQETITVERVLVDVRVTNDSGELFEDLTPADFTVKIAGKPAEVESAEFIHDTPTLDDSPSTGNQQPATFRAAQARGRTIVLFIQTDFAREPTRTHGQLNFLRYADDMLETFAPEDRFAVFSFDSHLKFRLDLTTDRRQVLDAITDSVSIDHPPPPPVVAEPSLAEHLDRDAMRRAAHSEKALLLVAHALKFVPGPKSMLLLGWGLGERTAFGVRMKNDWKAARYALDAARVSIFALDTSYADYHDLEIGLATAAGETGGFYAKTHLFPGIAVQRLRRTLEGHYELTLRASQSLKADTHPLNVRVKRRGARVLAPASVVIR